MKYLWMASNHRTHYLSHLNLPQMTSNWEVQVPQPTHQEILEPTQSSNHYLVDLNLESRQYVLHLNPNYVNLLESQKL